MSKLFCSAQAAFALATIFYLSIPADANDAPPTTRPANKSVSPTVLTGPLDFKVTTIDGQEANLADYKGKVVLIVNVASQCGFTPQYAGLQKLFEKYKERGFVVLAFPANNFGKQEPGTNDQIKAFAMTRFHVTFPMMAKVSVAGEDQAPLYQYLTAKELSGDFAGPIEWNFTKLLIGRGGRVVARFPAKITPEDESVIAAIEKELDAAIPVTSPKP